MNARHSTQSLDESPDTLMELSARTEVTSYMSRSDLMRKVRAILDKASVKPKPGYVPCRYAKVDLRSDQRNYVIFNKNPTTRNYGCSVELRKIRQIIALLQKALNELRTVANDTLNMGECTLLISTLTELKDTESYQS